MWSVKEYFNFVLSFVLPFGVMFELPVVIYMLARHGKVTYKTLSKNRKYVILVIAVVAAILTPPDVVSQCMLGAPMYLLYEIAAQGCALCQAQAKGGGVTAVPCAQSRPGQAVRGGLYYCL